MAEESWTRCIEVRGQSFTLVFLRRPFREGLEVRIETPWGIVSVAELGLGEQALIERARSILEGELARRGQ